MDGYQIATIIISVLLIATGGYIRLLTKEVKELISTIILAIEDNTLTNPELESILKEFTDVKNVFIRILQAFRKS